MMPEQYVRRFVKALREFRSWRRLFTRPQLPWLELDTATRIDLIVNVAAECERRGYVRSVTRPTLSVYPSFLLMGHNPFVRGTVTSYKLTDAGLKLAALS